MVDEKSLRESATDATVLALLDELDRVRRQRDEALYVITVNEAEVDLLKEELSKVQCEQDGMARQWSEDSKAHAHTIADLAAAHKALREIRPLLDRGQPASLMLQILRMIDDVVPKSEKAGTNECKNKSIA